MNNCPKCGNPLQVGVTSCPICGTNVASNGGVAPVKQTVQVSQVSSAPQGTSNVATPAVERQVNMTSENKVVASVSTPTQSASVSQAPLNTVSTQGQTVNSPSKSQVVASVSTPPVSNSMPVQEAVQTSQVSTTNAMPQNNTIQSPVQAVVQGPIAPTITSTVSATPVPSIPASLSNGMPVVPEIQNIEAPKKTEQPIKKKGANKTVLLVGVIIIIMCVAGGLYFMNSGTLLNKPNVPREDVDLAFTSVASNGFKFNLQDGWLLSEDGKNVIVTNSTDTVAIRLSESATDIANINEDIIKNQINRNTNFSNTEVGTTQISARDAYVVNTTLNETLPVQIYFIGGSSSLTLGVTIVYQTEDSKTKFESNILEMIGSISYSDESIKAISTVGMYSDAFNIYNNVVTNKQPEVVPPVLDSENENNQGENSEVPSEDNNEKQPEESESN